MVWKMKSAEMKKKGFSCFFIGLSIFLLFYVIKDFSYIDFKNQIVRIDWKMMVVASFSLLISAWFRNLRWLMAFVAMGYKVNKKHSFSALLLSYPANIIIPQSSFFIRASYLKKTSGIPIGQCFGTIIGEKLLDSLVIFGLFFFLLFSNLKHTFNSLEFNKLYILIFIFSVLLVIYTIKKCFPLLGIKFRNYTNQQLLTLKTGLVGTLLIRKKALFVFYTIMIWLPYFAIFYFLLVGSVFIEFNSFVLSVELGVMANISWIFPTQGGVGSYHLLISEIMLMNGFDSINSTFFAFFSHLYLISLDIIGGILVFLFNFTLILNLFSPNSHYVLKL